MTVAVIEFGEQGAEVEKGCVAAVLDAGFRALEPSGTDVDAALQSAGVVDYVKLGHTLGAELILDGGVPRAGLRSVQLAPRLISPVSNDVLATGKSKLHLHHGAPEGKNACARLLLQLP